ncbi:leucine-rich repeat transmembrane neuronal protein 4 [Diachasma alloeum]|uniref:leucine-rich repeat transmembrane neuronal protein 4 n=1 Tax=Diachasma alloeum TaxID=454923 RepID=UPI000738368C|nr:leucine-rich repeat transmembrane neuronal protein 4 [Diachasma alloeum]
MSSAWLLGLFCVLKCIEITHARCSKSQYESGPGYWLKCSNSTIADVSNEQAVLSAITMLNSNMKYISANSFMKHRGTLIVLNLQNCEIFDVHPLAFSNFPKLKKLSLSHNKLTHLESNWFMDLPNLEQLDVSYNLIRTVQANFFTKMPRLRLLSLAGNQLNCLDLKELAPLGSLAKIRISENPMSFLCRGQLTLWLKDHGINYSNERPNGMESWLDSLLWLCAIEDDVIAKSEEKMRQCVVLGMFNQFRKAIMTLEDYQSTTNVCVSERKSFLSSLSDFKQPGESLTNALAIENMIRVVGSVLVNN